MQLLDQITAIASRKKNRWWIALFLVFYVVIFLSSSDVFNFIPYDAEQILITFEVMLIFFAASLLLIKTGKSELGRYSEDYKYYLKKYPNEKENFIKYKCVNSCSIDYLKKVNINAKNIKIEDISFQVSEEHYQLPFLIEERASGVLLEKFNIQDKTDYNGATLSLRTVNQGAGGKLEFGFIKSYYFHSLLTNIIPEYEIFPNLTIRDVLEPSKSISFIEDSLPSNHLGISGLISLSVDNDRYFIIPRRTNNTAVFKGQLSPSVSGAANINAFKDTCGKLSIRSFFELELEEELSVFISELFNKEKFQKLKEEFLNRATLSGMSRELKRLGKPELFFLYSSGLEVSYNNINLNKSISKDRLIIKVDLDKSSKGQNIDENENASYFLIKANCILDLIKPCTIDKKIFSYSSLVLRRIEHTYNTINFQDKQHSKKTTLTVSESLLVNLILSESQSSTCLTPPTDTHPHNSHQ